VERLQKIIARAGIASRRAAEELILAGRVRVNGHVIVELGTQHDARKDRIEVDGKRLVSEEPMYLVLHKPKNVVSTMSDPEGRPTVADYFKELGVRLYPVGRLDFGTSGVLLVTNDGEFANGMLHPREAVPKTYVVKVTRELSERDLSLWEEGMMLEDGKTAPATTKLLRLEGDKTWFELTITEGRNQQIRRMAEAVGTRVMRLARISFAAITHEGLRPGQWRFLRAEELTKLRERYGVPRRVRAANKLPLSKREGAKRAAGNVSNPKNTAGRSASRAGGKPAWPKQAEGDAERPRRAGGKPPWPKKTEGDAERPRRAGGKPAWPKKTEGDAERPRRAGGKPAWPKKTEGDAERPRRGPKRAQSKPRVAGESRTSAKSSPRRKPPR